MKMIRATAKRTERRKQRIEGVIAKFPSLAPPSLTPLFAGANATYSFVSWTETDSETRNRHRSPRRDHCRAAGI